MSDWDNGDDRFSLGCMALTLCWAFTLMGGIAVGFWVLK